MTDLAAVARDILDTQTYMTIATADQDGRPWASPVYYAHADYRDFYWLSISDTDHSRNVAARPDVAIVVFNSQVPPGTGQGVWMSAFASEVEATDLDRALAVYNSRTEARRIFTVNQVGADGPYRLYRAAATRHWVLDHDDPRPGDHRIEVTL